MWAVPCMPLLTGPGPRCQRLLLQKRFVPPNEAFAGIPLSPPGSEGVKRHHSVVFHPYSVLPGLARNPQPEHHSGAEHGESKSSNDIEEIMLTNQQGGEGNCHCDTCKGNGWQRP
jgi:hypothetical protein